jgi:hypothetical protein
MSTRAFLITLFSLFLFISADSVPGAYEYIMNEEIDYSILLEDERMIPISWSNFDISFEETIQKVVVFVSTKRNYLGKWSGAFGTSTTVKPEYWTMTDDMAQSFTKKTGAIVWNVDEKTASIIQMLFEGNLKFGVWWFDCNDFLIEKVVVFTSLYKGGYPWEEPKEEKAQEVSTGVYKAKVGDAYLYKKLGADKMLPINWSQFDMIKNTTHIITRIDVTISTSAEKLGKWQGAFGSSTGQIPEYWLMTEDMEQFFDSKEGTLTWDIDEESAKAIQSQTDGQIKFGVWWVDSQEFVIETCTVYTKPK